MQKPNLSHISATKRILRYIRGTLDYGILFIATNKWNLCNNFGYTNSSWYGDTDERKSIVGYMFLLGGSPVALSSKKELFAAFYSCEVEYVAASLCACQTIWLLNIIDEFEGQHHGVMTVKIENMFTIIFPKNVVAHGRSKHI